MTTTKFAFKFLCERNTLDVPQSDYVFALMNFQDKKGDRALECLAGFYIYAIDKIGGSKASKYILETFTHDLSGANDKWCEPRSISYHEFWIKECDKYNNVIVTLPANNEKRS